VTAPVLSLCETVTAGPLAPNHVRRVGDEGLRPGGGIPGLALCGQVVARGWDLRYAEAAEIWELSRTINDAGRPWVCRRERETLDRINRNRASMGLPEQSMPAGDE
jgi:hypothetical protein